MSSTTLPLERADGVELIEVEGKKRGTRQQKSKKRGGSPFLGRPVTVDSGQKQATGTSVSGAGRYTRARQARRWSRAKVKWEISD